VHVGNGNGFLPAERETRNSVRIEQLDVKYCEECSVEKLTANPPPPGQCTLPDARKEKLDYKITEKRKYVKVSYNTS